jgi:hypothetical protein
MFTSLGDLLGPEPVLMSRRTMDRINGMSRTEALAAFKACCGSTKYAEVVAPAAPLPACARAFPDALAPRLCTTLCRSKLTGTCWALAQGMVAAMPFGSAEELKRKSDSVWSACGRQVSVKRLSLFLLSAGA